MDRPVLKPGDLGWFDVVYSKKKAVELYDEEIAAGNPFTKWTYVPNDSEVGECWTVWYGKHGRYHS